jgi:antitoxin component YwqK of YwqJK toxin-antitoxin module
MKYTILNGTLHGEHLTYYPDGKLASKKNYVNGELHGEQIDYDVYILESNISKKIKEYKTLYENGKFIQSS